MAINKVVLLVGGVGGAKLAYGLAQVLDPDDLTIVVNTGDDFWYYGLRICPDLDTILYTLGERVDKRQGWGVANDTTQMLDALARYGEDTWFRLGDLDMATHLVRTNMLQGGKTLTDVVARLKRGLNVSHHVLPMTNDEVATVVETVEWGEMAFQTYFVRHRWQPKITELHYRGAEGATPPQAVLDAIAEADAIVIGPSNPWLSIAPILAVKALRAAIVARDVPRVAVSPIVGGEAIKGPTAKIMRELGIIPSAGEVALYYEGVINGFVYDKTDETLQLRSLRTTQQQTVMRTDRDKILLAEALMKILMSWSK
jgi:LPPG:FO 2-phospho-L-lactate transferase